MTARLKCLLINLIEVNDWFGSQVGIVKVRSKVDFFGQPPTGSRIPRDLGRMSACGRRNAAAFMGVNVRNGPYPLREADGATEPSVIIWRRDLEYPELVPRPYE